MAWPTENILRTIYSSPAPQSQALPSSPLPSEENMVLAFQFVVKQDLRVGERVVSGSEQDPFSAASHYS